MKLSGGRGKGGGGGPEAVGNERAQRRDGASEKHELPTVDDLLHKRDFTGATELLRAKQRASAGSADEADALLWLGYALAHAGDYVNAEAVYKQLEHSHNDADSGMKRAAEASTVDEAMVSVYKAVCIFHQGRVQEAEAAARSVNTTSELQQRLLFHCAHKQADEEELTKRHALLSESAEDHLALAAVNYLRGYYQEAADIYKAVLEEHQQFAALNVYVALCYHKLDFYDISSQLLDSYLNECPDSVFATNARACNTYKLYGGQPAEREVHALVEDSNKGGRGLADPANLEADIIKHNFVVFRNGEGAQQHLPPLLSFPPETRTNLAMFHINEGNMDSALSLVKDMEPVTTPEYIVKAIAHSQVGQRDGTAEHLRIAQELFQTVGQSDADKDTIPGRECMASCLFLLNNFRDVLVYLESIRSYMLGDDDFNWNYGIAKAAAQQYADAEEALRQIQSSEYRSEYEFNAWLARCFIKNGKPESAWGLYLRMEASDDSFALLHLLANDCYRAQEFLFAAKAFDVLDRLDPTDEYARGKRGACVGAFYNVSIGNEQPEALKELVTMMRATTSHEDTDADKILLVMRDFARRHGIAVSAVP